MAREDPDEPFSLAPTEFLKGADDGTEIGLFLDSTTRRSLATHVSRAVLVVRANQGSPWRRLALASSEYQAVVRRIILFAPQWQGANGRWRRAEFFAPLFGHEDPAIYELAYLEMARAPYNLIKRLSRDVAPEQLDRILNRPQYLKWRSLAILLLAHCGTATDRERITRSFRTAERFRTSLNLAALAAASIEIDGAGAVSFIEERYLGEPGRSEEEVAEVFKALSLHGNEGRIQLRDQIVASYGRLLDHHPQVSAYVAADLLAWQRTEWMEQLSRVEATDANLDFSAKKVIRQYLRRTATAQERQ